MPLSSWSRLGLEISIAGEAPKVAQATEKALRGAIARQEELNRKVREYRDLLRQLQIAKISVETFGRRKSEIREEKMAIQNAIDLEKERMILTQRAASENKKIITTRQNQLTTLSQREDQYAKSVINYNKEILTSASQRLKTQDQLSKQTFASELSSRKVQLQTQQRQEAIYFQNLMGYNRQVLAVGKGRLQEEQRLMAQLAKNDLMKQQNLWSLSRAWHNFSMVFQRVAAALASFVILSTITRGFIGFFKSLITSNQLLETLDARLRALVPTTQEFVTIQKFLEKFTVTTPFLITEVVESVALIKAFGVEITKNMKAIGDWSAAIGRDLADTAVAFGKIAAYSPRTALLLSTRGFSMAAFEKYVSQYGDRVKALYALIEDTFGGTAERISRTFQGLLSNIKDLWNFISRTLGGPLFKDLKSDVQLVYNVFTKLNESGKETLLTIGKFIGLAVRGGAFLAIAGVIIFITIKMWALVAALLAGEAAAIRFSKRFIAILVTAEVIAAVYAWVKWKDAVEEVAKAQAQLAGQLSTQHLENIAQIERIIEGLERQKSIWADIPTIINNILVMIGIFQKFQKTNTQLLDVEIDRYVEILEKERLLYAEAKRRLVLLNAQIDALTDYATAQKIQELGLRNFLKVLGDAARGQALLLQRPLGRGGVPREPTQVELDQAAQKEAIGIYLQGIAGTIKLEEAIAKLKILFAKAVLGRDVELNRIKEFLGDLIQMLEEANRSIKKGVDLTSQYVNAVLNLHNKIRDLGEKIDTFRAKTIGELRSDIESKIAGYYNDLQRISAGIANLRAPEISGFGKQAPEAQRTQIEVIKLREKQLAILGDVFTLIQRIDEQSTTWVHAFGQEIAKLRNNTKNWMLEVASGATQMFHDITKGLWDELFHEGKRKQLTDQINDLRFQLIEIQQERIGIQVIEDQEASLLFRINELERERANIIGNILLDAIERFAEKLRDLALDDLVANLYETVFGKDTTTTKLLNELSSRLKDIKDILEPMENLEKRIKELKIEGSTELILGSLQDYRIGLDRLATEREIALLKGFGSLGGIMGPSVDSPIGSTSPTGGVYAKMNTIIRQPTIASTSNRSVVLNFNGPVYGSASFKQEVDRAMQEIKRGIV